MDTTKLVVGQTVTLFGCGRWNGTVVSVTPNGVGVASDAGFAQFDQDGKETEDRRYRRVGGLDSMGPEWQSWELVPATQDYEAKFAPAK